jgi:hypothetical protein
LRQLVTAGGVTFNRRAASRMGMPSSVQSTICARRTKPCGRLREAMMASKSRRSVGLMSKDCFGRPVAIEVLTSQQAYT